MALNWATGVRIMAKRKMENGQRLVNSKTIKYCSNIMWNINHNGRVGEKIKER